MKPTAQQLKYRKALEGAIDSAGRDLQAAELLAVTSHFVGQLIALQDQSKYTNDQVLTLVIENIQQGNNEAVDKLLNETGGNA